MLPSRQRGYIATKAVCRLLRVVNIEDAGGCEVCSSVAIQILGCQLDMGAILALSRVRGWCVWLDTATTASSLTPHTGWNIFCQGPLAIAFQFPC